MLTSAGSDRVVIVSDRSVQPRALSRSRHACSHRWQASVHTVRRSCMSLCCSRSLGPLTAGDRTRFQDGPLDHGVGLGEAGEHRPGGGAYVGTVQVGPDALSQVGDHVLGQTRVGARRAGLRALQTGVDAGLQSVALTSTGGRVCLDHLCRGAHAARLLVSDPVTIRTSPHPRPRNSNGTGRGALGSAHHDGPLADRDRDRA